jgi:hypothetical protein
MRVHLSSKTFRLPGVYPGFYFLVIVTENHIPGVKCVCVRVCVCVCVCVCEDDHIHPASRKVNVTITYHEGT